ncbi:hypothetical protein ACQP2Y_21965 [Actinoplanes sp. CA-051413]|uniref:hypothetical protein n=1 Tax=Actinoplanes sp. CA-051413 TaxID=3239899 RepID=UPI003D9928E3
MTVAVIRKLRSGGAVFELPRVTPHWFADWRRAVAEAESCGMEHLVLEPENSRPPVVVLAAV